MTILANLTIIRITTGFGLLAILCTLAVLLRARHKGRERKRADELAQRVAERKALYEQRRREKELEDARLDPLGLRFSNPLAYDALRYSRPEFLSKDGICYSCLIKDGPGYSTRNANDLLPLAALLRSPLVGKSSLLRVIFHASSTPADLDWTQDGNGNHVPVWTNPARVYRNLRPGTFGEDILYQPRCVVRRSPTGYVAELFDHTPLYPDDLVTVTINHEALQGIQDEVGQWYRDRYRQIRPGITPHLLALLNAPDEHFAETVTDALLCLFTQHTSAENAAILLRAAPRWTGTLGEILEASRRRHADELETYLALADGWAGSKRELAQAVRELA
jgi:hypothetical protein